MKNKKWLLLAGMAIILMTLGCQKQMGFVPPEGDEANAASTLLGRRYNNAGSWFLFFYDTPTTTPEVHLMSIGQDNGQNGTVTIYRDLANLYVAFHVDVPFKLYETHVDVELDSASLRHNKKGNLEPGQFPFGGPNPLNPPATDRLITIPLVDAPWLSGWNGTDPLAWAALCKVFYVNENGDTVWNTGCGGDSTNKYKTLKLPTYPVEMCRIASPFVDSNTYWQIGLDSIKEDSGTWNVWNGDNWKGWCMEITRDLQGCHMVTLKDSRTLTPADGPRVYKNGEWDRVNWLLNHKSLFPLPIYTYALYEDVIRYLLNDLTPPPSDYWELQMYNAAVSNGDGYLVPVGGWVAVVCVYPTADEEHQMVFIEVDP